MAKLQLGKAPTSFKRTVKIQQLDESFVTIELDFKYRTRTEYAELIDTILKPKDGKKAKDDISFADTIKELGEGTIDFILQICNGWDLEDEFNRENVAILVDQFPSASTEISDAYRLAILEGRIKN
jgi:hypothetical protein